MRQHTQRLYRLEKMRGFTLIEISLILVVISILTAIVAPNFRSWMPNLRFRDASQNLFHDLQLAKMTAIKQNMNVVLLISKVACSGLPDAVPAPGGGYTLFLDDGDDTLEAGEQVLKAVTMPENVALCNTDITGNLIAFLPTGLPKDGKTGKIVMNNDKSHKAEVSVSISGHIKTH